MTHSITPAMTHAITEPLSPPMTMTFNNLSNHAQGKLYNLACGELNERDIAQGDCLIGYSKITNRPDWPFGENYIEITAPATKTSCDMMPVVEAGMEVADILDVPLIITRAGSRSITLPYRNKVKP